MENARVHLFVSGRVQGVLFRRSAKIAAQELNVFGFAHNCVDGKVELVAEGEKENVKKFVAWCKKGPPFAKVENVQVEEEKYTGEFPDFSIREFGF